MEDEQAPRRIRYARPLTVAIIVIGGALLLVGWNRAASAPGLCSSCHEMRDATFTASRSLHADVPCLACHTRPGLLGSLRYVPTLAREGLAEATGWDIAGSVLEAAPCERCHAQVHPELATEAEDGRAGPSAACETCHGAVAHPGEREQPTGAHPAAYVQLHGSDVAERPGSCANCHETQFCQACHFRTSFPHPENWVERHGGVQEKRGVEACTLCHPSTFCAGCHGTEIPHASNWLGEHWRALQDQSSAPCAVCHPPPDCTYCHSRHQVHREQDLYG